MISYAVIAAVNLVYIGLKAIQQRHVMSAQYIPMMPTSMAMAYCEVFLWGNTAVQFVSQNYFEAFLLATAIGLGGGTGSMLGTYWHVNRNKGK